MKRLPLIASTLKLARKENFSLLAQPPSGLPWAFDSDHISGEQYPAFVN